MRVEIACSSCYKHAMRDTAVLRSIAPPPLASIHALKQPPFHLMSTQDAATALELALLKLLKGHDYCVPGPWAHASSLLCVCDTVKMSLSDAEKPLAHKRI